MEIYDKSILPKPKLPKRQNLDYDGAMAALYDGYMIKLPEWIGYWFLGPDNKILVFTADCKILDTPYLDDYRGRRDWETTNGTRDLGGAIRAMDAGCLVSRNPESGEFITKQIPASIPVETIPMIQSLSDDAKRRILGNGKPMTYSNAQFLVVDNENNARYWIPDVLDLTATDYFVL